MTLWLLLLRPAAGNDACWLVPLLGEGAAPWRWPESGVVSRKNRSEAEETEQRAAAKNKRCVDGGSVGVGRIWWPAKDGVGLMVGCWTLGT